MAMLLLDYIEVTCFNILTYKSIVLMLFDPPKRMHALTTFFNLISHLYLLRFASPLPCDFPDTDVGVSVGKCQIDRM